MCPFPTGRGFRPLRRAGFAPARRGRAGFAPARRGRARGRKPIRFPPSCQSPSFPSGRAARARVSDAFRLPPNCFCDRQGIGCHPRGSALPLRGGTSPSCCLGQMGGGNFNVTHPARVSAPLFAAANAANLRADAYVPAPAQRKRGDSQEGRNFVSPLFASRSERACEQPPRSGGS